MLWSLWRESQFECSGVLALKEGMEWVNLYSHSPQIWVMQTSSIESIKCAQLLPCAQVRQRATIVEYWDLVRNGQD